MYKQYDSYDSTETQESSSESDSFIDGIDTKKYYDKNDFYNNILEIYNSKNYIEFFKKLYKEAELGKTTANTFSNLLSVINAEHESEKLHIIILNVLDIAFKAKQTNADTFAHGIYAYSKLGNYNMALKMFDEAVKLDQINEDVFTFAKTAAKKFNKKAKEIEINNKEKLFKEKEKNNRTR